jgi:hypothetical protein
VRLPYSWKEDWEALYPDIDVDHMVREYCLRWVTAGKMVSAFWVDESLDIVEAVNMDDELLNIMYNGEGYFDALFFDPDDYVKK